FSQLRRQTRKKALDDSRKGPAPARVQGGHCQTLPMREQDRHAIGGHHVDRQSGQAGPEAIRLAHFLTFGNDLHAAGPMDLSMLKTGADGGLIPLTKTINHLPKEYPTPLLDANSSLDWPIDSRGFGL